LTFPISERWVTVSGLQLLVEDMGKGPVVLLAHGMWCDAGMFTGVAADLAHDHRVLVPDLRGHGRSAVPDRQWRIGDVADDLVAILDQLRVDRVTLAGFSMGGMAAVDFAVRHGGRLAGLALMGTSAAGEEMVRKAEIRALARLIELTGTPRFLAHEAARATFSPRFRRSKPDLVTRWESAVRAMPPRALIQALRAVASRPPLLDRLGDVRTPSLIIAGTGDRIVSPRWSRAMHRRLTRSRLIEFSKAGHAVPIELPGEVAGLLRDLAAGRISRAR
jgi:pimeloyl-ACP methyl ester carboxylesterase